MVHKISGKQATSEISHLHFNDNEFTDIPAMANTLGQTFSDNSSLQQYSTDFQTYRHQAENITLNFITNNTESYTTAFLMDGLLTVLSKSHDTPVSALLSW